jgi:hypothetical protein
MTTTPNNNYNAHDHLMKIRAKDGTMKDYLPANWRLYELRLRHPHITLESEIVHMDEEHNLVIVKAWIFDGKTYAESEQRASAYKQGQLSALDKVETAAKARAARDFGVSTELALDSEPEEDLDTLASTRAAKSKQNGNVSKPTEAPKVDEAAARRFINPLKMKALKAGFIAGSSDAELIKAWHEAKRSVFLREVADAEMIGSEELRVQMRDAIDRHVQVNQSVQKAS